MSTLSVRATEYTVGGNGPNAMPGGLPPSSGYTYAVELSADEALEAGATSVRFSRPIIQYVENFVGFPVGSLVPAGYYDRDKGLWVASDNGRVIKVIGATNGLADLDLDGDDTVDDVTALTALGVTDAERQQLASLYTPGQELWRVPIPHFTPWDFNWPYGPPDDAEEPGECEEGPCPGPDDPDRPLGDGDPCKSGGSIIECQTQTLGEVINLTGVQFGLHYQSDRVIGRRIASTLEIQLSGAAPPASLQRIHLEIHIAGRLFKEVFSPAPSLSHTFTWDRKDAYGRTLQGAQPVKVRIGYEYLAQYYATKDTFAASYNRFGASAGVAARGGGAGGVVFSRPPVRATTPPIILWRSYTAKLGALDIRNQGLGGWTLSAHHVYDIGGNTLYLGNGSRRTAVEALSSIIETYAGTGANGNSMGDNGVPAKTASLDAPDGVAPAPDGSLYILERLRVRRISPDGDITTVAGDGSSLGSSGDGGPATAARFGDLKGIALGPDGSLYVTDPPRVRRIGPDGIITTVAGGGNPDFCQQATGCKDDGGPATAASLSGPRGIALAPDGSLYIADTFNNRVRRVAPDGIITTVAGSGVAGFCGFGACFSGDGGPATAAHLSQPTDEECTNTDSREREGDQVPARPRSPLWHADASAHQ